VLD
ncbi:Crescent membrane and immature virion formation protein, partial [Monkeypox virus]|jgi:hypothetical protein